jgi:hypothetical protein
MLSRQQKCLQNKILPQILAKTLNFKTQDNAPVGMLKEKK